MSSTSLLPSKATGSANPVITTAPIALDRDLVLEFIRNTQPDEWRKLVNQYATTAETEFFKQLERALKDRGILHVLRNGIKLIPGIHFHLCYFQPASNLNPDLVRLYEADILSVIRQVRYSLKNENCIDTVLFVNGLPIATIEFKNNLTGTTIKHAEKQYRTDRSPAGEPLLTFKRGALVHFAVDEDNVSMTTRLQNGATRFLPFDRGRDGGAGNPDIPANSASPISTPADPMATRSSPGRPCSPSSANSPSGAPDSGYESLIFPRFQQLDAVRKIMAHARAHGSGQNYLIQHSAGSGKSNTIGWTAHQIDQSARRSRSAAFRYRHRRHRPDVLDSNFKAPSHSSSRRPASSRRSTARRRSSKKRSPMAPASSSAPSRNSARII